jgi:GntR family transcriptional regulator/MocR family aminotransferase
VQDANERAVDGTNHGLLLELTLVGVPRGEQAATLMRRLRDAIRSGSLPTGTRLPPSRILSRDLDVSRGVVVRAYEQLTAEGYLNARQGSGTEVAAVPRSPRFTAPPAPRPPTNPGLPSGAYFPRDGWLRSTQRALADLPDSEFGYGDPAGYAGLRTELSAYLGRVRALIAPPERILIVNGFGQASRLIAEVLAQRGVSAIGLEEPGSAGLREQLTAAGVSCVAIPVDASGIRVDALAGSGVKAVVVTPAHQFPTGVVMSPDRRHALLEWARDTGGLVIEDDYDAEFRYDRTPVGALQGLGPDVVVYGGSLSKTLAPGLRIGWLVAPDHLISDLVAAKYAADLGTGIVEQATLADFLARGELDRHIRAMSGRYRAVRDRLVSELTGRLPGWSVTGTAAGLHLVIHPPDGSDELILARIAQQAGLDARPLSAYAVGTTGRPGLVVGYGHLRPASVASAVAELARGVTERPRSSQSR